MSIRTLTLLAVIGLLAYGSLEWGFLQSLERPSQSGWLLVAVIIPSVIAVVFATTLVSVPGTRKYLIQPAMALGVIMIASTAQEATSSVDAGMLFVHAAAIVWFCIGFMLYVSKIPPDFKRRTVLVAIAGIGLLVLETPYLLYTIHKSIPLLSGSEGILLTVLKLAAVAFGLVYAYVLMLNLRIANNRTQGS